MTEKLKQAAQQALEALSILKAAFFKDASTPEEVAAVGCDKGYEPFESTWVEPAHAAIAALERALTQRPAAVDVEVMLAAVLPGGYSCDPQQVADAIRDYMALTQRPAAQEGEPTHPADCRCKWCKGKPPAKTEDSVWLPRRFAATQKLRQLGYTYDATQGEWLPNSQQATADLQAVCRYISDVLAGDAPSGEKHIARTIMHLLPLGQAVAAQQATPEPVGEPFGYFRPLPFGWEQCSEHDEGAVALYTHPAPGVPEGWRITRTHDGIDVHAPNGASVYVEPKAVGERKMPEEVLHALCLSLLTAAQQGAEQAKGGDAC